MVPISAVVCAKDLHPALDVGSGRMLPKSCMPRDLGAVALLAVYAVLPARSVLLLNPTRTDAVLRPYPELTLNSSRAH
jgi:hypothetical protein